MSCSFTEYPEANVQMVVTLSLALSCGYIISTKTMHPLVLLTIFSLVLAFSFLCQTLAIPIQSDNKGKSFRRTTRWGRVERFVLGNANTQGEYDLSEWVDYFKGFWEHVHGQEQGIHPVPSPSESPIPEGVGEFPEKVESMKSKQGINQAAQKHFVLNQPFYHEVEEEAPLETYLESKATLRILMKRAERGSLTGDEPEKWRNIIGAILKSFKKEKGAIFFDISFSELWTFCGWVEMKETFIPTDKYMRICASLISLGMDDITRPPEEGKDFIVPGESDNHKIEELLEPVFAISGRRSLNKTVRPDSVVVELLDYPEYCDIPLDLDPNCYGFCCLTPYYGSQFCHDCGF